jgi:hypothetical protein
MAPIVQQAVISWPTAISTQATPHPADRRQSLGPAVTQLAPPWVKGFCSERLLGGEPRAVGIMSMRARNAAGTCRRPG